MTKANPIQLQKFLKGLGYPAKKDEIVNHASRQGADARARAVFEQLPERTYETPADVSKEIGKQE